jgi:hypothetical protein
MERHKTDFFFFLIGGDIVCMNIREPKVSGLPKPSYNLRNRNGVSILSGLRGDGNKNKDNQSQFIEIS